MKTTIRKALTRTCLSGGAIAVVSYALLRFFQPLPIALEVILTATYVIGLVAAILPLFLIVTTDDDERSR